MKKEPVIVGKHQRSNAFLCGKPKDQTRRVGRLFCPPVTAPVHYFGGQEASPKAPTFGAHPTVFLHSRPGHQSGVVLIVSLIMLLLLTLIGTVGMQTTSLEEKMAGNMRDKNLAFQAAESALKAAEASLATPPAFDAAGTGGYYSQASTIPTPTAILTDSFWTTTTILKHTSSVTTLGNGIATPVYIIQEIGVVDCVGAAVGSGGCKNYRITARATGGSTNAVVILQSFYLR